MLIQPVGHAVRIAELDCVVVDPRAGDFQPQVVVVLCHGFGAPGNDLVDCCRAMWELEATALSQTRFIFPAGPLSLDEFGYAEARAWWPIDMARLNEMIASGQFRDLRRERPEALAARRAELTELVKQVTAEWQLDMSAIVLGGFSQGSMLTTDVALHLEQPPGGLIVWSGTLLNEDEWSARLPRSGKFPIFQSHGRYDPILPFAAAEWLHALFVQSGFDARFVPFDGMHEIPMPAMRGAARLVAEVAARR